MAQKIRILIADRDLNTLSRIYLGFLHKNFKVEATNIPEEITDRMKRLHPSLIILGYHEYTIVKDALTIPTIVLLDKEDRFKDQAPGLVGIDRDVTMEKLVELAEQMTV